MEDLDLWQKKDKAKAMIKACNGSTSAAANMLGIKEAELEALLGKEHIQKIKDDLRSALEKCLRINAEAGDTKAAEILLAAHYPEYYDSKVRYEAWKNRGVQADIELPELEIYIIPKSEDELPSVQ